MPELPRVPLSGRCCASYCDPLQPQVRFCPIYMGVTRHSRAGKFPSQMRVVGVTAGAHKKVRSIRGVS